MEHDQTVTEDINQIKQQIESLQAVDKKIDELNKLMMDIRDGITSSHNAISRHEFLLDEIRVNADFRKREGENSVREIKTQMIGMEHGFDARTSNGVDKIIDRLDSFEKSQREEITKLSRYFSVELDHLKKRVTDIERWNTFNIVIVLVVVVLVTLFP